MPRLPKWTLRREMRDLEFWLRPENIPFTREHLCRELETELHHHEPYTLGLIAVRLENLGLWESQIGAYTVLKGDDEGWCHLRMALQYYGWHLRIGYGEYERDLSQDNKPDPSLLSHALATRCLAQAIALNEDKFADWCGQRMLLSTINPQGFFAYWDYTPFHPFMARVYALWRGHKVDTQSKQLCNLGIYQAILDGWTDTQSYAAALLSACDYHCVRTNCRDDEYTDFWQSPFQVFPGEILAVQRVRKALLGSAPEVSHPLLKTPLGRVPASIPLLQDDLLARIIARISTDLPNA